MTVDPSYGRDQNAQRYHDWAAALNASGQWHRATSHPHPQFDPDQFFLHDAGVLVLDQPVHLGRYGRIYGTFGAPQGTIARFTNDNGASHQGGTCFGDSGGPTLFGNTNQVRGDVVRAEPELHRRRRRVPHRPE